MVFQTNQANERLVVKLFATPGKSCPMGVRRISAMRYRGAKPRATVQTSKTDKRQ
ncbi:hypothetical protein V466_24645 [Pseudomonas mandelii PD30]|uniref:Uncharacterized protein n=1 Tax=Pseudomonas mandelii PD30 TaxID=1419583 RepID=A0A059KXB8_9PSED|nr:hypothetical protein V466_24645 [Pseudomonas mandelii PD30]